MKNLENFNLKLTFAVWLPGLLLLVSPACLHAQNTTFTWQGRVTDNGMNFAGPGQFQFALITTNTTGTNTWWSNDGRSYGGGEPATAVIVNVTNGLFSVELGNATIPNMVALPVSVFLQPQLQLQVWFNDGVNGFSAFPLQPLTPAPYAAYASIAGTVVNNTASLTASNLTMTGSLTLPGATTIDAGGTTLMHVDGNFNFFAGQGAGNLTGSGGYNVALGQNALSSVTSGLGNTALGVGTLGLDTTGYYNTASGYGALGLNKTGNYNTAHGANALSDNTTGTNNVAIGFDALLLNPAGNNNVAVGTAALYNTTGTNNTGLGFFAGYNVTSGNNNIDIGNQGVGGDSGVIRIGSTQSQTYLAGTVNSSSLASGSLACSGEITGGSISVSASASCGSLIITGGSDLAEPFAISAAGQAISAGEVVVIDAANPGQLKLTDQPYDGRVAGVVSGANGIHPGIQMHQQGLSEDGQNVALSGRVYVQADTSNGPIQPGDLLTTSRTPGRAMRVTDHARAQGAILGKAMSTLKSGTGMVLVLVTLQ